MSFELTNNQAKQVFDDKDVAQMMDFLSAASKACRSRGKAYSFVCPICGAKAQAEKARRNGHLHAHCPGCGVGVME